MSFNINIWKKYYNQVKHTCAPATKAIHDLKNNGVCGLTPDEIEKILIQANDLCRESAQYMDRTGLRAMQPLWEYNSKDTTTWASSIDFKYKHLMRKKDERH